MMIIKKGLGWKACYDEERGLYTAQTSWRGDYHLYEIDAEIFNHLEDPDVEPSVLIHTGRHLYESLDNPIGPPTDIVYDENYASLCSWTEIRTSGHTAPKELTDFAIEHLENDKTREYQKNHTLTMKEEREEPILEAIRARHSVRKYVDKSIEMEKVASLRAALERQNAASGLNIQLVLEEPKCFSTGMWKYGQFSGVKNYFVMAGPKGKEAEERIGYAGEALVLLAQTLGLNTCWVGLTYKKIPGTYQLRAGDVFHCVIALGYGANSGVQHPLKPMERFYEAAGAIPDWFKAGMEAALLAPTAVNQQKFKFILQEGTRVGTRTFFSPWGYTEIDLGIVKYHFEVGAGKENFEWI